MKTPIYDFVKCYADCDNMRLHMPGHKGSPLLGTEPIDITEIKGADSLYEANGIIKESENNAGSLFGCSTFYSTEGSSQCIRAMLHLAVLNKRSDYRSTVIAGRNCHKAFLSAAALLDIDVKWIGASVSDGYLTCSIEAHEVESAIIEAEHKPIAVYITTPDYLGNIIDVSSVSNVCRKHGVLLLVDNAHGAYLKFLTKSKHPIDLGADMCCDSAHKTLPALTGAAYMHISHNAHPNIISNAKNSLALFGSTSPSYLTLQSLDLVNKYLNKYPTILNTFVDKVAVIKRELNDCGYSLCGDEPLKITIQAKKYGYTGYELEQVINEMGIVSEYSDPDNLVLMLTPSLTDNELERLLLSMKNIERRPAIMSSAPKTPKCERVLSIREAMLSANETVEIHKSLGRVLATASVSCPPAVPIIICGERINSDAIEAFEYYGIKECSVIVE